MIDLAGKTALVTGAARGIGRGCALALAQSGARLVINDRPGSPDLATCQAELQALSGTCHAVEADVFSRGGCESLVEQAIAVAGRLDILVSNPAYGVRANFLDYNPEDFEKVIQATLIGGFHMGQLVARQMVAQGGGGKIVFISSVQAEMPMARSAAYGAAKSGLNHLARMIAVELAEHRINVNVIQPGWIDTPGEHQSFGRETIEQEGAKLPWGRLGTPSDIGQAATFLCSDAADYITGSIITVDGGFRSKDCRSAGVLATND